MRPTDVCQRCVKCLHVSCLLSIHPLLFRFFFLIFSIRLLIFVLCCGLWPCLRLAFLIYTQWLRQKHWAGSQPLISILTLHGRWMTSKSIFLFQASHDCLMLTATCYGCADLSSRRKTLLKWCSHASVTVAERLIGAELRAPLQ